MAWDPEPGFHAHVTARRKNDKPVAWYSVVTYYGPKRMFRRRKVKTMWKSDEFEIVGHYMSKENRDAMSGMLEEAEGVAAEMAKEDLIR